MKVLWSDQLESGYDTIDEQHQELISQINSFFDNMQKAHSHESTVKTLNYLVKYVKFHFSTEEELMTEHAYPEYQKHLAAHKHIVEDLVKCYKKLITTGSSSTVSDELTEILQVWFVEHIMGYDLKLAQFLKQHV